jgi:hypothetical protein
MIDSTGRVLQITAQCQTSAAIRISAAGIRLALDRNRSGILEITPATT